MTSFHYQLHSRRRHTETAASPFTVVRYDDRCPSDLDRTGYQEPRIDRPTVGSGLSSTAADNLFLEAVSTDRASTVAYSC